jgi:hypothetical protein
MFGAIGNSRQMCFSANPLNHRHKLKVVKGRAALHILPHPHKESKRRIEEELHRFERFQLAD